MAHKKAGFILNQREYAERRGLSPPMIGKLIRQGKLAGAFRKVGGRYYIDPKKADKRLDKYYNPAKGKGKGPPAKAGGNGRGRGESFAEAARREKVAKARLVELKLETERGNLVERDRVEAVAAKLATLVRVGIEAIPSRVAPTVAGMKQPGDVARYIQKEVKTVLENLAEGIAKLDL